MADLYIYRQSTCTHGRWTPQSIEHRCLEYHYTKLGTSHGRSIYIYRQCTYTHGRWTSPLEHRCLAYHYTRLGTFHFLLLSFSVVNLQLTICTQFKCSFSIMIIFICICHHVATDHLHDYIHFTIYYLELHFWCSEAHAISAISPKTCTLKLQLLHNTKTPTKWSGHVKMINPPRELLHTKDLLPERVTI